MDVEVESCATVVEHDNIANLINENNNDDEILSLNNGKKSVQDDIISDKQCQDSCSSSVDNLMLMSKDNENPNPIQQNNDIVINDVCEIEENHNNTTETEKPDGENLENEKMEVDVDTSDIEQKTETEAKSQSETSLNCSSSSLTNENIEMNESAGKSEIEEISTKEIIELDKVPLTEINDNGEKNNDDNIAELVELKNVEHIEDPDPDPDDKDEDCNYEIGDEENMENLDNYDDTGEEIQIEEELEEEEIEEDEDDDNEDREEIDDDDDDDDDEEEDDDDEEDEDDDDDDDVHDNANINYIRNAHNKLLREDNNKDDVQLVISSDEEEEIKINPETIKNYPPKQNEILKNKINRNRSYDSFHQYNYINDGDDDEDDYDDDNDDDDDEIGYEDNNENDDLMNDVFMISNKNTSGLSSHKIQNTTSAEVKNYQEEKKTQYIKNYLSYEMKAVKRSIKWLNNKRMQKHDIHASNRMPSTSKQHNNDAVKVIGFGNYDRDTNKLQQEKLQQQKSNESISMVPIEIEDSPEKQSVTTSSILLKSQLMNNRENEKEMQKINEIIVESLNDKIVEIVVESSSTQNQQEQQKQQQQHQDHLQHLQQKNQENDKRSYNNDKNSSSLKNIIAENDVAAVEKTDDNNEKNNVISVDLLEIKENNKNDQQVKNNTENSYDDKQRRQQQQTNEDNDFSNSAVKIAIKSMEEKEFTDNSNSKTEENKNKPLLQNNSGNSSNDVNKKFEEEKLNDKKLNKAVEDNNDESIMDVDEDVIAKHLENEDVSKEKTKITDDDNKVVNAEIVTPIIKTTITTHKRKRSHSDCDEKEYRRENNNSQNKKENEEIIGVHPIKKLRAELESNYPMHNKILNDYIERTSNNSVNDIQKNINQLLIEIQTLNDMIKANEIEWENMIHLKKVKEEICCRLTRKKHLKEIMSTKCGEINDDNNFVETSVTSEMRNDENQNDLHQKQQQQQQQQQQQKSLHQQMLTEKIISSANNSMITSTPNHNNSPHNNYSSNSKNNLKATVATTSASVALDDLMMMNAELLLQSQYENSNVNKKQQDPPQSMSITQSILQSRANMKSSDLAKKRASVEHIHRILVSRNILPKPSSSSLLFDPIGMSSAITGHPTTSTTVPATTILTTSATSSSYSAAAIANANQMPAITTTMSSNENLFKTSLALCAATSSGNNCNSNNNNMKINTNHHHIQPTILNSYLTAEATVQQQLEEMLNGHHRNSQINNNNFYNNQKQKQQDSINSSVNNTNGDKNLQQPVMIGRQGIFKDVKSIIADYRQKHPEVIPRRGRRLKGSSNGNSNPSALVTEANSILGNALKSDSGKITVADYNNSRPSSNDSSHSMTNILGSSANNTNLGNLSFKDVLVQFAKMSRQIAPERTTKSGLLSGQSTTPTMPPYPEVTLHPVVTSQSNTNEHTTGSLLHGILTKQTKSNNNTMASAVASTSATNNQNTNYKNEYSPTLARLLTAPERTTSNTSNNGISFPISSSSTGALHSTGGNSAAAAAMAAAGLNLSKVVGQNSEITITPVTSQSSMQQSLLQQQQRQQQHEHQQHQEFLRQQQHLKELIAKERMICMDDEADDSVDRLVIDEGGDSAGGGDECHRIAPHAIGQEFHENEVPICQGCKKQEAQFVCAGCGNQWYCSRDCQVAAWDEHSEICTG